MLLSRASVPECPEDLPQFGLHQFQSDDDDGGDVGHSLAYIGHWDVPAVHLLFTSVSNPTFRTLTQMFVGVQQPLALSSDTWIITAGGDGSGVIGGDLAAVSTPVTVEGLQDLWDSSKGVTISVHHFNKLSNMNTRHFLIALRYFLCNIIA